MKGKGNIRRVNVKKKLPIAPANHFNKFHLKLLEVDSQSYMIFEFRLQGIVPKFVGFSKS